MGMTRCKDCQSEISTEARKCPHCGRPNKSLITGARVLILVLVVLVVLVIIAPNPQDKADAKSDAFLKQMAQLGKSGDSDLAKVSDQVALDAVAQYEIAKRQGDPMQICVQAGYVAAAQLQAKHEDQYRRWKATEKADCTRAGVVQ